MLSSLFRSKKRIVLVDDEYHIREVLKEYLKALDVQLQVCESASQVLELVKKGNLFDLVIVDVLLPGFNGVELVRELRKNKAYKETPILFISGRFQSGGFEKLEEHFSKAEVLGKPFSGGHFLKQVSSMLKIPYK